MKDLKVSITKFTNTTTFHARKACRNEGIADLNNNNKEEMKDLIICLSKKAKSFENPTFLINFYEKSNEYEVKNLEKVVFLRQGSKLIKQKLFNNVLLKNIICVCKNHKSYFLYYFMITTTILLLVTVIAIWIYYPYYRTGHFCSYSNKQQNSLRNDTNVRPQAAECDEPMTKHSRQEETSSSSQKCPQHQLQLPKRETERRETDSDERESESPSVMVRSERVMYHKRQYSRKLLLKKQKGGLGTIFCFSIIQITWHVFCFNFKSLKNRFDILINIHVNI